MNRGQTRKERSASLVNCTLTLRLSAVARFLVANFRASNLSRRLTAV
jgi:hypothetical protein